MINRKQYMILSFFLTRSLFMVGIYNLLINLVHSYIFLVCFIGFVIGLFILYLYYKKSKINKYVMVLISIVILITNITANTVLNNTYLLFKTPPLLIMISFLLLCLFGAFKGIKNIARTSFVFSFITLINIILGIFGLIGIVKFSNIMPIINQDFINIIKGIFIFAATALIPNLMLINYKSDLKFREISIGYVMGCLYVILIMFFIIGTFGYELSSMFRFPEYLILKKINFFGLTNIDNVLVMDFIVNVIICGLVAMYVLKDNCNKCLFYVILFGIILGMIFLVFRRNYVSVLFIKYYSSYVFMGLILLGFLPAKKSSYEVI